MKLELRYKKAKILYSKRTLDQIMKCKSHIPVDKLVVFGIELKLFDIHFINFQQSYPKVTLNIGDAKRSEIIPYSIEAKPGDHWNLNSLKQITFTDNPFKIRYEYKMTFELSSPIETDIVGIISYDIRPFLADAIANMGRSPPARATAVFKDLSYRNEVAELDFEFCAVFFKFVEKKSGVHSSPVKNLTDNDTYLLPSNESESFSSIKRKYLEASKQLLQVGSPSGLVAQKPSPIMVQRSQSSVYRNSRTKN